MSRENIPRAALLNSIPSSRYRIFSKNAEPPKQGDIVELDQAFTSPDGRPMVLAYGIDEDGSTRYEAEVYESELSPPLRDFR